jgi:AcrR family transcriptional regulator
MTTSNKPLKRVRRSHAERSESTRKELIEATIRVIEERGLEGASIYEIARAAGMTPGAIQHHYESKWALIREAAAHLIHLDDQYGKVEVWPKTSGPIERRARTALTSAWNAMYAAPHYLTMWSIFLSCRTESELLPSVSSCGKEHWRDFSIHFPNWPTIRKVKWSLIWCFQLYAAWP